MRSHTETSFLVLRLTPFGDTSLVLAGISPEHGQLHFMVRGARRPGSHSFPTLDLFRRLQVTYREGAGELHRLGGADLVADYGALARSFPAFQTGSWLARFALANVLAGVEHRALFEALCVGLGRLAALAEAGAPAVAAGADAVAVGVCLTYLQEAGWLAADEPGSVAAQQCECLLAMAAGGAVPRLTAANWRQLRDWVQHLARSAGCQMPDEA